MHFVKFDKSIYRAGMMKAILKVSGVILSVMIMAGCGKAEDDAAGKTAGEKEYPAARKQDDGSYRIEIEGDDKMQYGIDRFSVPAGVELTVVLKHVGTMSRGSMGHNWVLLARETPVNIFMADANGATDTDYIPAGDWEESIIAHVPLLGGGETGEVTFTVPGKPGSYEYVCTFPGHYYAGMKGVLIVE